MLGAHLAKLFTQPFGGEGRHGLVQSSARRTVSRREFASGSRGAGGKGEYVDGQTRLFAVVVVSGARWQLEAAARRGGRWNWSGVQGAAMWGRGPLTVSGTPACEW